MTKKALLDECLEHALARALPRAFANAATTVQRQSWHSKKNGELLQLAAQSPDVDLIITADKAMLSQQNERSLPLPVIVLAPSERLGETRESLMRDYVADLLLQDLDDKFYVVGNGPRPQVTTGARE